MNLPGQTKRILVAMIAVITLSVYSPAVAPVVAERANDSISAAPEVKILNSAQVYYPSVVKKGTKFKKPAILTTSTVFDAISEWKQIKRKGLRKSDAEYHLLLKKANEKFNKALKAVQAASSYDIMAEVGAIECKGCTPEDVTQTLIANLPS